MGILCKMLGAIFVMGAAGYFAVTLNHAMDTRKQELRKLYSILLQLKSEIQYMYNPLPESFDKIGKGTNPPFSRWLTDLSIQLNQKDTVSFCEVWNKGLEQLYKLSTLEKDDIQPLYDLADKLGTGDVTAQMKAIDYALLHIEGNRVTLEGEISQKKKIIYTTFFVLV